MLLGYEEWLVGRADAFGVVGEQLGVDGVAGSGAWHALSAGIRYELAWQRGDQLGNTTAFDDAEVEAAGGKAGLGFQVTGCQDAERADRRPEVLGEAFTGPRPGHSLAVGETHQLVGQIDPSDAIVTADRLCPHGSELAADFGELLFGELVG